MKITISQYQAEQIVKMRDEGHTFQYIADTLGLQMRTAARYYRVERKRQPVTQHQAEQIIIMRNAGQTFKHIAETLGVNHRTAELHYTRHMLDTSHSIPPPRTLQIRRNRHHTILTMIRQGHTIGDIAVALGITIQQCRNRLRQEQKQALRERMKTNTL